MKSPGSSPRTSKKYQGTVISVYAAVLSYLAIWIYLLNGSYGIAVTAVYFNYPLEWKVASFVLVGANAVALTIVVFHAVLVLTQQRSIYIFWLLTIVSAISLSLLNFGSWLVIGLLTLRYQAEYWSPQP